MSVIFMDFVCDFCETGLQLSSVVSRKWLFKLTQCFDIRNDKRIHYVWMCLWNFFSEGNFYPSLFGTKFRVLYNFNLHIYCIFLPSSCH